MKCSNKQIDDSLFKFSEEKNVMIGGVWKKSLAVGRLCSLGCAGYVVGCAGYVVGCSGYAVVPVRKNATSWLLLA